MAMFTITATFAPALGPLLGGWLTDNYGWPFIFYINIIPGTLLIAAVWFTMDMQPMNLGLLKRGDWWGILTMAIGLAAFEIVLEDGNRKDWFGDPGIVKLAWLRQYSFPPSSSLSCVRESRWWTYASLHAETSGLAASSI
jgi:DHA2 family multidrug resistance protein